MLRQAGLGEREKKMRSSIGSFDSSQTEAKVKAISYTLVFSQHGFSQATKWQWKDDFKGKKRAVKFGFPLVFELKKRPRTKSALNGKILFSSHKK